MPLRWHLAAQPVGCHNRQVIEGCSQPFSRTLQSIDGANGLQHMLRGGALLASRGCRQPRARHCSSRAENNRSPWSLSNRRVRNSLNTEKSKPGPVSSKQRHVLPVDARADRFGRLSIRVVFHAAKSHAPPELFPREKTESLEGAMTCSFSFFVPTSYVLTLLLHALLPFYPPCSLSTSPTGSHNETHPHPGRCWCKDLLCPMCGVQRNE